MPRDLALFTASVETRERIDRASDEVGPRGSKEL
jgi:hypothetical protein